MTTIAALNDMKPDCANCPLADCGKPRDGHYVNPSPALRSLKLLIVIDQPRANDSNKQEMCQGSSGQTINKALRKAGIARRDVEIQSAIGCWDRDATPAELRKAAKCCAPRLKIDEYPKELPRVAMGQHALYALRGHYEYEKWSGARAGSTWVAPSLIQCFANPHMRVPLAIGFQHAVLPNRPFPEPIIRDGNEMRSALRELTRRDLLSVDIETAGSDPLSVPTLCIGVSSGDLAVSVPWQVDAGERVWAADSTREALAKCLAAPSLKIAHNGHHDFLGLAAQGLPVGGKKFDTIHAHAVVAPELPHRLQFATGLEEPIEAWKAGFVTSADPDSKGAEVFIRRDQYDLRRYNAKDCVATEWLYWGLLQRLPNVHNYQIHMDRLTRLGAVGFKMTHTGLPVAMDQRDELAAFVSREAAKYKAEFEAAAGNIDAGSEGTTKAVKIFFFGTLKAPVLTRTDTGAPSLGKDALQRMTNKHEVKCERTREAAKTLLKFKLYGKLYSTFLSDKFPIDTDNRVRANFREWGTISRRLSSNSPNMQQLPGDLRAMFVAPESHIFVAADLKQVEPRLTAEFSEDPALIEVFVKGLDLYKQVASKIFKIDYAAINKSQRKLAKMVFLASAYGSGVATMQEQMAARGVFLSEAEIKTLIDGLASGFSRMVAWRNELVRKAEETGYVEEPFTEWRRHFPDGQVEASKVFNFPLQAGAAALVNNMVMQLDEELDWEGGESLVAQIHDEITLLVPKERGNYWQKRLPEVMYRKLEHVELVAEAAVSREWIETK
ncbi:MAG: DNA polymerase [Cyanobacteria bacterium J06635_11]